ncbi:MAG: DUF3566 domain-containing protein [Propionibacterium sp.]|nr:DUF3566 domain-containing protein [Propionibacterium sp.]
MATKPAAPEPGAGAKDAAGTDKPRPNQPVHKGPRNKASARAAAAAGGATAGAAVTAAAAGSKPDAPAAAPAMGADKPGSSRLSTAQVLGEDKKSTEVAATDAAEADTRVLTGTDAKEATTTTGDATAATRAGDTEQKSTAAAVAATVKRVVGNPSTHRTRKARLRLAKFDPWSVMKTTFLFAIAFMIASLAAVMLLYSVISSSGVFEAINEIVGQVLAAPGDTNAFRIEDWLTARRVAGFTLVVGVLNVVLMTAIGTLAAFLYNLAASLLGGLEVTLAED